MRRPRSVVGKVIRHGLQNDVPSLVGNAQERARWNAAVIVAEVVRCGIDDVRSDDGAGLVPVRENACAEVAGPLDDGAGEAEGRSRGHAVAPALRRAPGCLGCTTARASVTVRRRSDTGGKQVGSNESALADWRWRASSRVRGQLLRGHDGRAAGETGRVAEIGKSKKGPEQANLPRSHAIRERGPKIGYFFRSRRARRRFRPAAANPAPKASTPKSGRAGVGVGVGSGSGSGSIAIGVAITDAE